MVAVLQNSKPQTNLILLCVGVAACRLHFDPSSGMIKEQWTWRGACADEAAWLLNRSYKPFDCSSFLADASSSDSSSSSGGGSAAKARATGAALAFREAFGAVPGADVSNLAAALSEGYECKVGTSSLLFV